MRVFASMNFSNALRGIRSRLPTQTCSISPELISSQSDAREIPSV